MISPARLFSVLVLMVGSLVFFASPAHACSCAMADTATHVDWADQVFTGTVTDSRATGGQTGQIVFDVRVDRVFKGDLVATVQVATAATSSACGIGDIPVDSTYVFFTTTDGMGVASEAETGVLHTGLCSGSAKSTQKLLKQVEAVTGAGRVPEATTAATPDRATGGSTGRPAGESNCDAGGRGGNAPLWPFVTGLVVVAVAAGSWSARRTA